MPSFLVSSVEELFIRHVLFLLYEMTNLEVKLFKKIFVSMKPHQILSHRTGSIQSLSLIFIQ